MTTDIQAASREIVNLIPLVMRMLGSELRNAGPLPATAHFRILFMLGNGPHNLSSLAQKNNVSLPTMSNSISILVERGWVQRTRSQHDRRSLVLEITPAGQAVTEAIRLHAETRVADMLDPLSADDVKKLLEGMAVLRIAFDHTTPAAHG